MSKQTSFVREEADILSEIAMLEAEWKEIHDARSAIWLAEQVGTYWEWLRTGEYHYKKVMVRVECVREDGLYGTQLEIHGSGSIAMVIGGLTGVGTYAWIPTTKKAFDAMWSQVKARVERGDEPMLSTRAQPTSKTGI